MPKLRKSANESSCTPNSLVPRTSRATKPSSLSVSTDKSTNHEAASNSPSMEHLIDNMPKIRLQSVTRFGAR
jgi:hypothetical protein